MTPPIGETLLSGPVSFQLSGNLLCCCFIPLPGHFTFLFSAPARTDMGRAAGNGGGWLEGSQSHVRSQPRGGEALRWVNCSLWGCMSCVGPSAHPASSKMEARGDGKALFWGREVEENSWFPLGNAGRAIGDWVAALQWWLKAPGRSGAGPHQPPRAQESVCLCAEVAAGNRE